MKVIFNHISGFGKMTDKDFIYSDPKAIVDDGRFIDALNEGWIEWGDYWYNLRSVRINTTKYEPTKTTKKMSKRVNARLTILSDKNIGDLKHCYEKYVSTQGFARDIALEDFLGMYCIMYEYESKVIGGVVFRLYEQYKTVYMVSYQFFWDYEMPKLSLGNVSQYYECDYARSFGIDYVYILGGYEDISKYKSKFKGFEWWTGREWSTDVKLYNKLCRRDTKIEINADI